MTGTSLVNLFSRAVLGVLSNTDIGAFTTENELVSNTRKFQTSLKHFIVKLLNRR